MLDYQTFKNIEELFSTGQRQEGRRLLMEMQSRCIALHDEMDSLRTQLREFEDIVFLSKSLHFERTFYWLHLAELRHGPFCPVCYEGDNALLRLQHHEDGWRCPRCHARFTHADCVGETPQPLAAKRAAVAPARRIPFGRHA